MRNINAFYNDYHVMSYDEGNVVSCYRDTPVTEEKNVYVTLKDSERDTIMSNNTGAFRFCPKCGSTITKFSTDVYKVEVHYWPFGYNNYFPKDKSTRNYQEHDINGWVCPDCVRVFADNEVSIAPNIDNIIIRDKFYKAKEEGSVDMSVFNEDEQLMILNNKYLKKHHWNNVELDNSIELTYSKASKKDLKWIKDNKEMLNDIYDEYNDNAGVDKEKECCSLIEDAFQCDINSELKEPIVGITWNTESSSNYMNVIGYNNERTGYNHGVVWSSIMFGKSTAKRNLDSAIAKFSEHDYMRNDFWELTYSEYSYIMELIEVSSISYDIKKLLPNYNYHIKYTTNGVTFMTGKGNNCKPSVFLNDQYKKMKKFYLFSEFEDLFNNTIEEEESLFNSAPSMYTLEKSNML